MNLFAVKWYEYAGQTPLWRAFWHDLASRLSLPAPEFHTGATRCLWENGTYTLTWACGGDVALHGAMFAPLAIPIVRQFDDTPAGLYRSLILTRANQSMGAPATLRIGVNYAASQSGHLALARWWHAQGWARPHVMVTGGHEASVQALLAGEVDLIALDSQGYPLLCQAYPALKECWQIDKTEALPAPPLCVPSGADRAEEWRETLASWQPDTPLVEGFRPVNAQSFGGLASMLKQQISDGRLLAPIV